MAKIMLDVHVCGTYVDGRLYSGHTYRATFATDTQAIDFIGRKSSTCAFWNVDGYELPDSVMSALYPECEHGLSASLCMGPEHYPSNEQEMAMTIY